MVILWFAKSKDAGRSNHYVTEYLQQCFCLAASSHKTVVGKHWRSTSTQDSKTPKKLSKKLNLSINKSATKLQQQFCVLKPESQVRTVTWK